MVCLGWQGAVLADPLSAAGEERVRERVSAFHVVESRPGTSVDRENGGEQLR